MLKRLHAKVSFSLRSGIGCTPESFPDLTGNRSNLKRHVFERKRFESQIGRASFVDGVGELKSTPLAVAQAAWALLLVRVLNGHSLGRWLTIILFSTRTRNPIPLPLSLDHHTRKSPYIMAFVSP